LSKVELLERDVSRLRSCKNKIDSRLLITFPSHDADGYLDWFDLLSSSFFWDFFP